ncbi:MAG: pyridoxamine kinase [Clostridium sp.]|uniref:pyridoxamine kinase n=1 Tax=Clostridium sp. LY3-2 TaxID=2942482 RepID=UPI002152F9CC|nr:pyridoxamine kinase [Clostridium sp. LY3-2]MCR6515789.1 pyridoxamine kinase [Clostridium sp. LY3-2]
MKDTKKIAVINDISGVGRCSLTASIPIISALGSQVLPVPTCILSNQTGFDKFYFKDLSSCLTEYLNVWLNEKRRFDVIYTGFIGSIEQINPIINFVKENKNSLIITDPILGDDGEKYKFFTNELCKKLNELIAYSDLITPNLTEACILLDYDLNLKKYNINDIKVIAEKLCLLGPSKVIITGIKSDSTITNLYFNNITKESFIITNELLGGSFSGTGDLFISTYIGLIQLGKTDAEALEIASNFIYDSISYSLKYDLDPKEGVSFEKQIPSLLSNV